MPRPRKPQNTEDQALRTLVALSSGEIEVSGAAQTLGMDEEALIDFVEANPDLVHQAEAIAREQRLDPEHTLQRSSAGLAAAISTLATRIETHGSEMPTGELVQASQLLEKLLAINEQRKLELKAASEGNGKEANTQRTPIVIHDTRPCPKTGNPRMKIILVEPESAAWVDFGNPEFRAPNFDWLETFLPFPPKADKPIDLSLLTKSVGFRFMDERGRIFGGHL